MMTTMRAKLSTTLSQLVGGGGSAQATMDLAASMMFVHFCRLDTSSVPLNVVM
eukprot:XP_001704465.1 Hypothetical protein GL50803_31243 [Giardia lamblia ATCC 50803]